ncbi:MAG: ABC transporter ATP-binding protein [Herbiconiux sp.]|uniref:ABC transporter ATP-binding protein n=1 Tax=Herbiconiux sp. TaxID=1871186 RepID=UPI0011F8ED2A|nr:MAG: ABC transporter ATP-binding protein [Herbiconiux sp.]
MSAAVAELRHVVREFGGATTVRALAGVDLALAPGDFCAIVGASGAGKSTLLNVMGLLDRLTAGEYFVDGVATSGLNDRQRSAVRGSTIGFVFQSFHLLATRSVLDNVLMAFTYGGVPRSERRPRAVEALDRVGLGARLAFSPATLSGGERQRVAIARAVCAGPRLLLADEPTGNLDRSNSESVMELFAELNADGLTIAIITHDDEVAGRAHRRLQLRDGTLHSSAAEAAAPAFQPSSARGPAPSDGTHASLADVNQVTGIRGGTRR